MLSQVFAVFDVKVGTYSQPFFSATQASAMRSFASAVADPTTMLNKHPGDFTLYHLGVFDDESGFFESIKPVMLVGGASIAASLSLEQKES